MSQRTGWPGSGTWSVCNSSALLGSYSDHSHSCSKPSGRFSSCLLLSHEDRPKQGSIESYLWVIGACDALWGVFPWGHYIRNQWVILSVRKSMTKQHLHWLFVSIWGSGLGRYGPICEKPLLTLLGPSRTTPLRLPGPVWQSTSSKISLVNTVLLHGAFGNFWRLLVVITGKMLLPSTR